MNGSLRSDERNEGTENGKKDGAKESQALSENSEERQSFDPLPTLKQTLDNLQIDSPKNLRLAGKRLNSSYSSESHIKDKSKVPGRWSLEEHQKFVKALSLYGKNWKKVEEYIKTRTGAQIRSHAQKYYNKQNKHTDALKSDKSKQEIATIAIGPDSSLQNSSLHDTILKHTEVIESLQRMLRRLEKDSSDSLVYVELEQGEKLCEAIAMDAKKALPAAEKSPALHTLLVNLIQKLNDVYESYTELSPQLKEKNYSRYLADLLKEKYDMERVYQAKCAFESLSDWVTGVANKPSTNSREGNK